MTIFYNNPDGEPEVIGELAGREAIAQAVTQMVKPHPPREWSHNATDGLLIDIDANRRLDHAAGTESAARDAP